MTRGQTTVKLWLFGKTLASCNWAGKQLVIIASLFAISYWACILFPFVLSAFLCLLRLCGHIRRGLSANAFVAPLHLRQWHCWGTTQKRPLSYTVALRCLVPFFFFHSSPNMNIVQMQYADTEDYTVKGIFMRYKIIYLYFSWVICHVMSYHVFCFFVFGQFKKNIGCWGRASRGSWMD